MRAFYLDCGVELTPAELGKAGVSYFKVNDIPAGDTGETWAESVELRQIREALGFKNHDIMCGSRATIPAEKLAMFFDEHLHEDEEIRFILDGAGCFDIRDGKDRWVRIHVTQHDLIIIPAGIYHRFSLDDGGYVQALRLFSEAPKWIAINRSEDADQIPAHVQWLVSLSDPKPLELAKYAGNPSSASSSSSSSSSSSVNSTAYVLGEGSAKALAHYPHMRRVGNTLYLSGCSSRREDNTHRGATKKDDGQWDLDIGEQTAGVIENMSTMLAKAGATLANLVDVQVYLVNMDHYAGMNQVYNQYFQAETGPTRTTVAVHQLPHPNLLIEIKGIAVLDSN